MPGDWQVLEKSQDFEKKDAQTIEFRLPLMFCAAFIAQFVFHLG